MPDHRILIALDYDLTLLGGAQRAALLQAAALARSGCTVDVLAPTVSGGQRAFDLVVGDAPARLLPFAHRGVIPGVRLPLVIADADARARAAASITGADAVVVHSEFGLAAAVVDAARSEGVPVLHTVHTAFWRAPAVVAPLAPALAAALTATTGVSVRAHGEGIGELLRRLTFAAAARADAVLSPSVHQAAVLRAAGLRDVHVLGNTVEDVRPRPFPVSSAPLRLVWAGRPAPEKRLGVAVRGVRIAAAGLSPSALRLDIAGAGARRTGPSSSVHAHGRLPASAVGILLERAHAALVTSLGFDNQPLVALEAFRRGRPVIVSDPALAREFGDAAILTDGPDSAGLASTLRKLHAEPGRLRMAAEAARELGEQASPAAHVRGLLEVLADLKTLPARNESGARRPVTWGAAR